MTDREELARDDRDILIKLICSSDMRGLGCHFKHEYSPCSERCYASTARSADAILSAGYVKSTRVDELEAEAAVLLEALDQLEEIESDSVAAPYAFGANGFTLCVNCGGRLKPERSGHKDGCPFQAIDAAPLATAFLAEHKRLEAEVERLRMRLVPWGEE